MISAKTLFEELQEGEEYAIVMMRINDYHQEFTAKERATLEVRQSHNHYKNDDLYKSLSDSKSKASKALSKREFELNHK